VKAWIILIFFICLELRSESVPITPLWRGNFLSLSWEEIGSLRRLSVGGALEKEWNSMYFFGGGFARKYQLELDSGKEKKRSGALFTGFRYKYLGFWMISGPWEQKLGLFLFVHPTKKIFFQRTDNQFSQFRKDSLGLLSGDSITLSLGFSKIYWNHGTEWEVQAGIGAIRQNWQAHFQTGTKENIESPHTLGGLSIHSTNYEIGILTETPTYTKPIRKPKRPIYRKKLRFPHLFKQKSKVYPMSVAELLEKGVPVREAILLQKASTDSKEYFKIIKTLPKDTRAKCMAIQKQKQTQEEREE
jgi:hypothetical protein